MGNRHFLQNPWTAHSNTRTPLQYILTYFRSSEVPAVKRQASLLCGPELDQHIRNWMDGLKLWFSHINSCILTFISTCSRCEIGKIRLVSIASFIQGLLFHTYVLSNDHTPTDASETTWGPVASPRIHWHGDWSSQRLITGYLTCSTWWAAATKSNKHDAKYFKMTLQVSQHNTVDWCNRGPHTHRDFINIFIIIHQKS